MGPPNLTVHAEVSLAWLLAFVKLLAWRVYRVVGLFTLREGA